MDNFLAAFLQFLDYVIKAIANYRLTPEGEKEWQDIFKALNAPAEPVSPVSVSGEDRDNGDVPTTDEIAEKVVRTVFQRKG